MTAWVATIQEEIEASDAAQLEQLLEKLEDTVAHAEAKLRRVTLPQAPDEAPKVELAPQERQAGPTSTPVVFTPLLIQQALALDADECTLGYLHHLPDVGSKIEALAEYEAFIVEKLQQTRADLKNLRAKAHNEAWAHWTEEEIGAAVAAENAVRKE